MRTRVAMRRAPSLLRVPTLSLDEIRERPGWPVVAEYLFRFITPAFVWAMVQRFFPRRSLGLDGEARAALLGLTNNWLAALGLLYAIYFGMSFQSGTDRLRELRNAISREASGLQSVVELSLTLDEPSVSQLARLHATLSRYIDHVLSNEVCHGVRFVRHMRQETHSCVSGLYDLFAVFKELASNGEGDAVDLRTLDALHDEVRDIIRARAERINLTNQHLPVVHWAALSLLSICTIAGVAINDLPSAPVVSGAMAATIGLLIPLSYCIVADMARPFSGAWSVSDEPFRGVRRHVLPRLAASAPAAVAAAARDRDKIDGARGGGYCNNRAAGASGAWSSIQVQPTAVR